MSPQTDIPAAEYINVRLSSRTHAGLLSEAGRLQCQDGRRRTLSEALEAVLEELRGHRERQNGEGT